MQESEMIKETGKLLSKYKLYWLIKPKYWSNNMEEAKRLI